MKIILYDDVLTKYDNDSVVNIIRNQLQKAEEELEEVKMEYLKLRYECNTEKEFEETFDKLMLEWFDLSQVCHTAKVKACKNTYVGYKIKIMHLNKLHLEKMRKRYEPKRIFSIIDFLNKKVCEIFNI